MDKSEARLKYFSLIKQAKSRTQNKEQQHEKHHIAPRALFPALIHNPKNIVMLTPYEHVYAHYLLCFIYPSNETLYAFHMMCNMSANIDLTLMEESAYLREQWHKSLQGEKNPMYGKKHSLEALQKMSEAKKGEKNPMYGKCGELSPNYGKKHTEETKEFLASFKGEKAPNYGKPMAESAKLKLSMLYSKPIVCINKETGIIQIFSGCRNVEEILGIPHAQISKYCKYFPDKPYKGCFWRYASEEEAQKFWAEKQQSTL